MTQEIKTHSNRSNARRAARNEGLDLDNLTFLQNDEGRWFYQLKGELMTVALDDPAPVPQGWDSVETGSDAVILAGAPGEPIVDERQASMDELIAEAAETDRPGENAEIAAEAALDAAVKQPRRWDSVERMVDALTAPSGCTMVELWRASGWKARPGATTLAALEKSKGFIIERFEIDGKKRVRAVYPAQALVA